ncbi:MAG: stealth family protein [Eubacteriales bacterium]|nr:stealth family protein [Eubacteriales bacterium]
MNRKAEIDIVVLWVDDKDPQWQKEKAKYTGQEVVQGNEDARYRDWDTLKYWFRGVEKFAPWVRNIYFVTADQKPQWLNLNHPQLKWVKHSDFIPSEYLPTFKCNTIELNLHRIEGLSENFVYLNDDVFIIKDTNPEDFFVDGLPCDSLTIDPVIPKGFFAYTVFNDCQLINRHFSPKDCMKKHRKKFLKAQSLSGIFKNLWYGRKPFLYGIRDYHIYCVHKKSTIATVWEKEHDTLDKVCQSKLRTKDDINLWCVRYWNLLSGNFYPKKPSGRLFHTTSLDYSNEAVEYIKKQKGKVACINDTEEEMNFEIHKKMIIEAFEEILPEKSAFEL